MFGALQAVIPAGYASSGIWMGFGMSVSFLRLNNEHDDIALVMMRLRSFTERISK